MTTIEAIQVRKSCRTYSEKALEPEKRAALKAFLAGNTRAPFHSRLRFALLDFDGLEAGELKALTTYGVIRGARTFIVGAVGKHRRAMEDFGYAMERAVLKATSLGLGTCILGGTFKRSGFAGIMGLQENERLPAVSPVGYPREKKSLLDRVLHLVAGSARRKPWNELFYLENAASLSPDDPSLGRYQRPLEAVRLAPSAMNRQPWRIIKGRDAEALFHFYLRRTPGYEKLNAYISLQHVDMGIALCHFEESATELGLKGSWSVRDPRIRKLPTEGLEYIASWTESGSG